MVEAAWFSHYVGYVLGLGDDADRCVGVQVNDYAVRVAYVTGCINNAPRRFSTYFYLFLFDMDSGFFRIDFVFFGYIDFYRRICVIRAMVFSTRFLRRFGTYVRFIFDDLGKVVFTVP